MPSLVLVPLFFILLHRLSLQLGMNVFLRTKAFFFHFFFYFLMVKYPQAWGFSFRNVPVKWTYKPGHQNTLTSFLQIRFHKGCQSASTAWTSVGKMKNCW